MGAGKLIAIIGGILGILSIVLFYVLPDFFCLWRIYGGGDSINIGGFGAGAGTIMGIDFGPEDAEDTLLVIIGVLLVAGGAIAIIGGLIENKMIGVLGGIIMLAGPILLSVELLLKTGFWDGFTQDNLFLGSAGGANWGVWIGFFMGIGGGVLGLVGGASLD
jgi:hypothetical protein